jgi:hypothetical protein
VHSIARPSNAAASPRALIRLVALPLLLLALAPSQASAQLRGLSGSSPIGGVVGGRVDPGNIGVTGAGNLPESAPSTSGPIIGPTLSVPIRDPAPPRPDTVTNTLNGSVGDALSLPGRATNQLGSTLGQRAGAITPNPRRQSGVPPRNERRFVPNEVMVRLPSTLSEEALDALARRHGLTRLESQRVELTGTTFHRWRIDGGRPVADIIRALEADAGVSAAQPNYRFSLMQTARPSPAREPQTAQYVLGKLDLPRAHRVATGDQVRIAVIDSGIDIHHPEIEGHVAARYDAVNANEPPHAHGTAMAGAIVAHGRLTGVAPSAHILAIRAFSVTSNGTESTTLTLLRAIDWAVANGARVINMSFAGPTDPEIARALAFARKRGVVLIAAAGNAGPKSSPLFPASDPNVIAVTATDTEDRLFAQANRGKHIAVAAPGVDVLGPAPGGLYQSSTGTSVAAAHVSGIAALLIERKGNLTPDAVRAILTSTATDLGPKGRDNQFGAGLANAYRALQSIDALAARGASASARNAR